MELGRIQQTTSPPPSVPVVDTSSQASLEDGQEQPRGQSGPALTGSRPATTSSPVKEIAPKMSCCYGLMVFLGLTVSLLALTLLVVYVGVLSHQSLYDEHLIVSLGGSNADGQPTDITELLSLPEASRTPTCPSIRRLPKAVTGAVGTVLLKHLTYCGGRAQSNISMAECYKYTYKGWQKFANMTKPRAFAASAWIPKLGWWVTGGLNEEEPDGISTTDLFSLGDDNYGSDQPRNAFLQGPILPEAVSHHCLIKRPNSDKYLLIGGMKPTNSYSSLVWEYDWIQRDWSLTAPLLNGRHSHACSLSHEGEVVVVAGGISDQTNPDGATSVEMLDLSTSIWHKLPSLPHALIGGRAAKLSPGTPYGHGTFALVGGSLSKQQILQFVRRAQFETGNEATERSLSYPRNYAAVLTVSPRLVCL